MYPKLQKEEWQWNEFGCVASMILLRSSLWEIRLALICFCPPERALDEAFSAVSAESVPSPVRLGQPSVLI